MPIRALFLGPVKLSSLVLNRKIPRKMKTTTCHPLNKLCRMKIHHLRTHHHLESLFSLELTRLPKLMTTIFSPFPTKPTADPNYQWTLKKPCLSLNLSNHCYHLAKLLNFPIPLCLSDVPLNRPLSPENLFLLRKTLLLTVTCLRRTTLC